MKVLILSLAALLTYSSFASTDIKDEFLGGVLKTRAGSKMALKCVSYFEDGNCREAKLMEKSAESSTFTSYHTINIEKLDMDQVRDEAYRRSGQRLDSSYNESVFSVSVNILVNDDDILLPVGLAIDAAKAPVLLAIYLVHKPLDLIARRRMIKGFKFMLDPRKKSKERRISSRYFVSLGHGIRN